MRDLGIAVVVHPSLGDDERGAHADGAPAEVERRDLAGPQPCLGDDQVVGLVDVDRALRRDFERQGRARLHESLDRPEALGGRQVEGAVQEVATLAIARQRDQGPRITRAVDDAKRPDASGSR